MEAEVKSKSVGTRNKSQHCSEEEQAHSNLGTFPQIAAKSHGLGVNAGGKICVKFSPN